METYEVYDGDLHIGTLEVKGNRHRYQSCAPMGYVNELIPESQDWGKEILFFHNRLCDFANSDDIVLASDEDSIVLYRIDE